MLCKPRVKLKQLMERISYQVHGPAFVMQVALPQMRLQRPRYIYQLASVSTIPIYHHLLSQKELSMVVLQKLSQRIPIKLYIVKINEIPIYIMNEIYIRIQLITSDM